MEKFTFYTRSRMDANAKISRHVSVRVGWITNKELFEEYAKQDGSPIGRIKE